MEGRAFITHNPADRRTSSAVLLRTTFDATSRVRFGVGAAAGDRIFDVASLATGSASGGLGYVNARLGLTSRDFVTVGVSAAREDPSFTYWSATLGYRRVF